MAKQILLEHGSGGKLSHELVRDMFLNKFPNPSTVKDTDAALLDLNQQGVGFTTDSYVVDPIFFPGGDIGRLAVSGTVNDLLVSGYRPRYLSASFIIEEGFPMQDLEKIVDSMVEEAKKAGISIVTGDTKVVDKGKCDKLFINTTGVGEAHFHLSLPLLPSQLSPGDVILINGHLGDHGIAVMAAREGLKANGLVSDVAPLNDVILPLLDRGIQIKFMRDATRGGVATVLNEITAGQPFGIIIQEENLPVRESVTGMCEMLGFDPLYVANEGKVVMVVPAAQAKTALFEIKKSILGENAAIIGQVTSDHEGMVVLATAIGGTRIVNMLTGRQLPRIC